MDDGKMEIVSDRLKISKTQEIAEGSDGVAAVFVGVFEDRKKVAVKRIISCQFTKDEAETLSANSVHENIVRYYATEKSNIYTFLVMELSAGTLEELVNQTYKGPEVGSKNEVLRQIASGVEYLHSKNVIHRNLKPQNVLISQPDGTVPPKIKLADFGLERRDTTVAYSFAKASSAIGSIGWTAPETLFASDVTTFASDIFSLGCVFAYVLTGQHPYGEKSERITKMLQGQLDWKDGQTIGDDDLTHLIGKMVARDPTTRPDVKAVLQHRFLSRLDQGADCVQQLTTKAVESPKKALVYDREFLLELENSPLSHKKPEGLASLEMIRNKAQVFQNPYAYNRLQAAQQLCAIYREAAAFAAPYMPSPPVVRHPNKQRALDMPPSRGSRRAGSSAIRIVDTSNRDVITGEEIRLRVGLSSSSASEPSSAAPSSLDGDETVELASEPTMVLDRAFLLDLESHPYSRKKPQGLPDLEFIRVKRNSVDAAETKSKVPADASNTELMELQVCSPKEDRSSPAHPEGKKAYDREFLLELRNSPLSQKIPEGLPNLEVCDKKAVTRRIIAPGVIFTPPFVKIMPPKGLPKHIRQEEKAEDPDASTQNHVVETKEEELEKMKTEELLETVRGILNELTPSKFDKLSNKMKALKVDTEERLAGVVKLFFDKAVGDSMLSSTYAKMCQVLSTKEVSPAANGAEAISFRKLLLAHCQKEFEKDSPGLEDVEKKKKEIEEAGNEDKKKLLEKELEDLVRNRKRSLGNIRFIGELFKLRFLSVKIMHKCIDRLLSSPDDEESLECLCCLLSTIGKELETPRAQTAGRSASISQTKQVMDGYFSQLGDVVNKRKVSNRIMLMIQNLTELRRNNWNLLPVSTSFLTALDISCSYSSAQIRSNTMPRPPIMTYPGQPMSHPVVVFINDQHNQQSFLCSQPYANYRQAGLFAAPYMPSSPAVYNTRARQPAPKPVPMGSVSVPGMPPTSQPRESTGGSRRARSSVIRIVDVNTNRDVITGEYIPPPVVP